MRRPLAAAAGQGSVVMGLSAKLNLRQSQALIITPQLMQAIRLLQMSGQELETFVTSEMEQNPLLRGEKDDAPDAADEAGGAAERDPVPDATDVERASLYPEEAVSDLPNQSLPMSRASTPGSGSGGAAVEGTWGGDAAASESFSACLERQADSAFADPAERLIARALLEALDPSGYLIGDMVEIAERLGVSPEAVGKVLARCQAFEPAGLFARSLSECLALQLKALDRFDPAMEVLLAHLNRLASRDFEWLAGRCGVDREDLAEMVAEIRCLDPKPGLSFDHDDAPVLIPDVHVRRSRSGTGWVVELNDQALPRLIVDRTYYAEVSSRVGEGEDRRFLSDCLQKASWLERSLDQRAKTILKVSSEIVRRQEAFLVHGVSHLKPLNLRMIADKVGLHESTVSRATANKSLATPRGIFEFKFFFSSSVPSATGEEAHSAEAVKHRIRQLIAAESAEAVLSDDGIVAELAKGGIEIARRTVAKYREAMGIGSSVERRRAVRLRKAS